MMTRIKYHKSGASYVSNCITNYEGSKFVIFIHNHKEYGYSELHIVDNKGNAIESIKTLTIAQSKRKARYILINKYNVRLIEEIRPRS